MGAYVNPPNETKEEFLLREGIPVTRVRWQDVPADSLPVILCHNPGFTAAGIAYSEQELTAFTRPGDMRIKEFWLVKKSALYPVSDLEYYLPEE